MPSKSFLDYSIDVGQFLPVIEVRQPIWTNNSVNLLLGLVLCIWMHGHRQEEGLDSGNRLKSMITL